MSTRKGFGLQLHITDMCDQRCEHCYIYAGKDIPEIHELSIDELDSILKNFIDTCDKMKKKPFIAVTGGDPLLHSDIWTFLKHLKEHGVYFSILGNPFHITEEVALKLKELGCTNYQMSLDGLRETHDKIRKNGSFDATLSKIPVLRKAGLHTSIMTTVSKMNIHELPELVDIVVASRVDNFAFARYCPNPDDLDMLPSPQEYREFLDKMWQKYVQYEDCETRFALKDHLWKLYLYEKGLFKIDDIDNPEELILDGCHCGISHITVLSDGLVYACRRSETPVGNVFEESLYDIFFGDRMEPYRQYRKFEACSKCELKNFCRGCPSVAKCATGNFYAKDPQCWKKIE